MTFRCIDFKSPSIKSRVFVKLTRINNVSFSVNANDKRRIWSPTNVQTFSWDSVFQGSTDIGLPVASSGGNLYDYVGFVYNSTASKWQMIAKVFGF